jgi:hypothetical protein
VQKSFVIVLCSSDLLDNSKKWLTVSGDAQGLTSGDYGA